jgi:hypothetical protein
LFIIPYFSGLFVHLQYCSLTEMEEKFDLLSTFSTQAVRQQDKHACLLSSRGFVFWSEREPITYILANGID